MPRARLSRDDWVRAGLAALLEAGPDGVTVEGVATRLGATKGSGYWHFASREDLLTSVVARWRVEHTQALTAIASQAPDARGALETLFRLIFDRTTTTNEARVLLSSQPALASVVHTIAEERITFVTDLTVRCGIARPTARRRAEAAYCLVVGHEVLLASAPGALHRSPADRRQLAANAVSALLAPTLTRP